MAKQKTSKKTTKKTSGAKKAAKPARRSAAKATTASRTKAKAKTKAKATGTATASRTRTTAKKTARKTTPKVAAAPAAAKKAKKPSTTPKRETKRKRPTKTAAPVVEPIVVDESDEVAAPPKPPKREKLSAKELEQFRQMLIEKRAELMGDVSTLHNEAMNRNRQDATGDLSTMPIHMADLGTDNYELEFTLGLIEGERTILREIDEALKRIDDGTYGFCLATGDPIGKARLKAKPWAKYSYDYTLAQERGQTRRT